MGLDGSACPKVPMQENISDPYNDEVGEHLAKKATSTMSIYIYICLERHHVLRKFTNLIHGVLLHNLHHSMHAMLRLSDLNPSGHLLQRPRFHHCQMEVSRLQDHLWPAAAAE